MNIAIKPSFARRWLAVSLGLWVKLAPALAVISVALKLLGIGAWAAMPWPLVVFYPALTAFLPLALLGGWLAVITHDWNQ
ncbi:hypothetical protein LMG22037_06374 [Paraburkholderia phenoliruptrix]|uniref:Uncharacterized protein n=1 Tax=Paraburkholderia phenoliruptrix TaxID=252970 RepID=A0A6J5CLQ4_9BURK|nr:hypothetical protein [Paraburkholderia phenoliruptrix]CAB3740243.1 hypothetical protein LMG22037_06374 [Paraburkholderia phenoliruptrix]